MKVLVGSNRLGPVAVFLPDGSHAVVPAHEELVAPLVAQVQARGPQASFEEYAQRLVDGSPYAGRWSLEQVPDGSSASQALYLVRYRAAGEFFQP